MRPTERALELMDELREQLDLISGFAYTIENYDSLKRQIEQAHREALLPLFQEMKRYKVYPFIGKAEGGE